MNGCAGSTTVENMGDQETQNRDATGVDGAGPSQATGEVLSVLEQFYHTIV